MTILTPFPVTSGTQKGESKLSIYLFLKVPPYTLLPPLVPFSSCLQTTILDEVRQEPGVLLNWKSGPTELSPETCRVTPDFKHVGPTLPSRFVSLVSETETPKVDKYREFPGIPVRTTLVRGDKNFCLGNFTLFLPGSLPFRSS